jgi:aspartyl-tRNA(Asn)/glutamyl-tRNA(Gln) amidotransferase subunit B
MAVIKTDKNEWEIVIGIEIHAQINSKTKLFSPTPTEFGANPNSQVSLIDAAMPGMLPVLNKEAVKQTIKTGLAFGSKINQLSIFDRKNYFYADLPQGYQISQFSDPIVLGGSLTIKDDAENDKVIGITRIHMEQDAGKLMHDQNPTKSFVDLNRSGVPLMEIVTEPDMRSSIEAANFVKKLRNLLRHIGSCDADMEKGNLRCDANISLRKLGTTEFGTRCEIKNLNSIKNIQLAIDYEAKRQAEALDAGETISQQTRLFNVNTMETKVMRDKEDAHDYRYFPDPDLVPLRLSAEYIQEIADNMPELPHQKLERYTKKYNLSEYDAEVIISDIEACNYFEELIANSDVKLAVSWMTGELFGRLNKDNIKISDSPVTAKNLAELLELISKNVISGKIAKDVLDKMFSSKKSAKDIVASEGLEQISDDSAIIKIIDDVLADNPDKVTEYKNGKDKLFGFFIGQIMKLSKGKANPAMVNKLLKEKLA